VVLASPEAEHQLPKSVKLNASAEWKNRREDRRLGLLALAAKRRRRVSSRQPSYPTLCHTLNAV